MLRIAFALFVLGCVGGCESASDQPFCMSTAGIAFCNDDDAFAWCAGGFNPDGTLQSDTIEARCSGGVVVCSNGAEAYCQTRPDVVPSDGGVDGGPFDAGRCSSEQVADCHARYNNECALACADTWCRDRPACLDPYYTECVDACALQQCIAACGGA